jgi:hypothetical protein
MGHVRTCRSSSRELPWCICVRFAWPKELVVGLELNGAQLPVLCYGDECG